MDTCTLTYSSDLTGPYRLYLWNPASGYHAAQRFSAKPRHRMGELTSPEAMRRTIGAVSEGLEVRITNAADELIFHCAGRVLHPADIHGFWVRIGAVARLIPYIPRIKDTAGDGYDEQRAWMCFDWLSRVCAPAFMDLTPALSSHADTLRALPAIDSPSALSSSVQTVLAAAWAAAWDAAGAAAWAAAWAAARDAAWDAAGRTLNPVVRMLQESAFGLLDRMCDVGVQS